jgi:haloacid dehalogenase superfamily, subfamily IA, variant 3 with third motif having DD or ED/haloacid dehalogenase superfamily, subfamily IA, variant 1 with third motif having Dx(3-4)D or Dx(3-4)E
MIKALLFDYGGTLDTNGHHWAEVLWNEYLAEDIQVTKAQFREAYVYGERTLDKKPLICPEHNFLDVLRIKCHLQTDYLLEKKYIICPIEADRLANAVALRCYQIARKHTASTRATLAAFKQKYKLALVSNFYGNLSSVLRDFDLYQYFDKIIESAHVNHRKPDPQIFRIAVDDLELEYDECVVIGDSYTNDILPAQEIGCATIWLRGTGWDEKPMLDDNAVDNCIAVITHFNELDYYLK